MSGGPTFDGALRFETRVVYLPESAGSEQRVLTLSPTRPFKPRSLLLWGARPGETFVDSIVVGGARQTEGRLPGHLFESEIPFSEFEGLLEPRGDYPAITRTRALGHYFAFDCPAIGPFMQLTIEVTGPLEHGVLLGRMMAEKEAA